MRVLNKKHWPIQYRVADTLARSTVDERAIWCRENLPKGQWFVFVEFGSKVFAFKESTDLTVFKLRWK